MLVVSESKPQGKRDAAKLASLVHEPFKPDPRFGVQVQVRASQKEILKKFCVFRLFK